MSSYPITTLSDNGGNGAAILVFSDEEETHPTKASEDKSTQNLPKLLPSIKIEY